MQNPFDDRNLDRFLGGALVLNEITAALNKDYPDLGQFHLLDPQIQRNPYPCFKIIRKQFPLFQMEGHGLWVVSRYKDVVAALENPQLFSSQPMHQDYQLIPGLTQYYSHPSLISLDPPIHTKIRRKLRQPFTLISLKKWKPVIAQIIDQQFHTLLKKRGDIDLVRDFAAPIPVKVLATLLGIEEDAQLSFQKWSKAMLGFQKVIRMEPGEERNEAFKSQLDAAEEFTKYFIEKLAEKRQKPGDDLISHLCQTTPHFTDQEIMAMVRLFIGAGHESTSSLIAFALLALKQFPIQKQHLSTLR